MAAGPAGLSSLMYASARSPNLVRSCILDCLTTDLTSSLTNLEWQTKWQTPSDDKSLHMCAVWYDLPLLTAV
jgi:hypothetical protein